MNLVGRAWPIDCGPEGQVRPSVACYGQYCNAHKSQCPNVEVNTIIGNSMNPEYRATIYLSQMREKYQQESKRNRSKIYVAKLDNKILDSRLGTKYKFPKGNYFPDTEVDFKGCVYVGLTTNLAETRFRDHLNDYKAGRGAVRDFHYSTDFGQCCGELTRKYGFERILSEDRDYIESWVGWVLCNLGYYVWGSHLHETEDFLGKGDFL